MPATNRSDFQELARIRRREAKLLLDARQYSGAYHLAGMAVECALKACICKRTKRYDFPPKPIDARDIWTHELEKLLKAAELWDDATNEMNNRTPLGLNLLIVKDWKIDSRYEQIGRAQAKDFYTAVAARRHGVFRWLRRNW